VPSTQTGPNLHLGRLFESLYRISWKIQWLGWVGLWAPGLPHHLINAHTSLLEHNLQFWCAICRLLVVQWPAPRKGSFVMLASGSDCVGMGRRNRISLLTVLPCCFGFRASCLQHSVHILPEELAAIEEEASVLRCDQGAGNSQFRGDGDQCSSSSVVSRVLLVQCRYGLGRMSDRLHEGYVALQAAKE
jgi:hypothetical protein